MPHSTDGKAAISMLFKFQSEFIKLFDYSEYFENESLYTKVCFGFSIAQNKEGKEKSSQIKEMFETANVSISHWCKK
jgi:hypothetical protein